MAAPSSRHIEPLLPAGAASQSDTLVIAAATAAGQAPTTSGATTIVQAAATAAGQVPVSKAADPIVQAAATAAMQPPASSADVTAVFPQVIVEIAWADGPLVASPTWTDVSADVLDVTVTRGRSEELGRFETGTMTIRLRNTAGAYDPTNTGSAYAPNVLPMRQIRARAVYNAVGYPLFRGHVEEYEPSIVGVNNAEITLTCVDVFAWLANVTIVEPLYAEDTAGQRILDVLGDIGWPSALYSVRTTVNQSTVAEVDLPDSDANALDLLQQAADSELGDLYVDGAGILTFRDRRQKIEIAQTSAATFGDDITSSELPYTGLDPSYGIADVVNHAVVSLPDWDPSEWTDATSITAYGERAGSYDTQLAFPADADTVAQLLVWRHKQPRLRFTGMNVKPSRLPFSATALWAAALAAEVGVAWTVKNRPPGGWTVNANAVVIGLTHSIRGAQSWQSTFRIAQPDPTVHFFKIEDATYGVIEGPGVIAY